MELTTYGILYGASVPEEIDLGSVHRGVLSLWYDLCEPKILDIAKRHGEVWVEREFHYIPCVISEDGHTLCGFWLLTSGEEPHGDAAKITGAVSLRALRTVYADQYRRVRRRWWRFAKWARTQGVVMQSPRFWLAPEPWR